MHYQHSQSMSPTRNLEMFAECPCAGSEAGRTFLCCFFGTVSHIAQVDLNFFFFTTFFKEKDSWFEDTVHHDREARWRKQFQHRVGSLKRRVTQIHRKEAERECWSSTYFSLYAAHHPSPWDDASTFTVGLSSSGKPRTDFNLVQLTRKTDYHRKFCTKPHNFSTNEIRTLVLRTRDNYAYSFYLQDAELLIFLYLPSHSCDYKHMLLYKWD